MQNARITRARNVLRVVGRLRSVASRSMSSLGGHAAVRPVSIRPRPDRSHIRACLPARRSSAAPISGVRHATCQRICQEFAVSEHVGHPSRSCTELESRECHYYHGIDYAGSSYRWEVKWDCLSWRSARKVQLKFVRKCLSRIETRVPHVPKLRTPGSFAGTLRGKLQRACLARNRRCLAMARRQTTPDRQAYSCALPRQRGASRLFMTEIVLAKRVRRA
jgi:hypothetical protein